MEILLIAGTLSGLGGIETCIRALAQEAEDRGDHVRILALCASTHDPTWQQGLDYAEVAHGSTSLRKQLLRGLPAMVKACRSRPADAVIAIYSSTIPGIRLALWLAGRRRPVVSWLHFSTVHRQRTGLLRYADAHLCISSEIASELITNPRIAARDVHLVFNGTRFDGAPLIPRSNGAPVRFLHVGRLMMGRQKRSDDLLRALAQVEGEWRLDLVGAGDRVEDLPALKALAAELGIEHRLTWHGRQRDPWTAAVTADLLVLTSAFEGFPMVLIEAMVRGVPCLSTDCSSGPADVIKDGLNGWLFAVGDCSALAERLQGIVHNPSLLPPASGVRASAESFSSRKVYQRIRAAMQQAIAKVRGASFASPWE
ncbi:N-acetylgalactosamine-N, N'-diacetylbacillosaminyl-diphospho-undecaprenol 4-alpha-N-acetylgalactosaminyltransferase [Variovorax sp. SRS16]|uniref:glycosyltransferase n=1 Tax=Variovorax sp. SRS16 TaxID=282217 RepID=UPI001318F570|nr:glycosyltransferase [Variovorax sp. SRS16]VTU14957.1 N-acetylgalactosamine-N, N'-diacetylbacillosaminyl-diphospho-undecaprenol 4-alpha-N-acetylgalactosaminyltransferase [Variovorax sp. SRS16]